MSDNDARSTPDRAAVLACYAEGIGAIANAASRVANWDAPTPCGAWTSLELVGHLLAIVRYYHRLLDGTVAGRPLVDLPRGTDLAAMNARDLAALTEKGGNERADRFVELARDHLERLRATDWDQTVGTWSGLGDLSVAQHAGVALGEWHVHAWDLSRANGDDHRPSDPLVVAEGQHVVFRARGPGDPWEAVLRGYERDLHWGYP